MEKLTKSRLKVERGWTNKLMKNFLPEPDETKLNPHYKSGPPMLLFKIQTIQEIEQTESFQKAKHKTEKRKRAAQKAVEKKRDKLNDYLGTLKIEVPIYSKTNLVSLACKHYNEIQQQREAEGLATCGLIATPASDPQFLRRICVNYLRHCLTSYEVYLDKISGKVGFAEGYETIRRIIFDQIAVGYPWLAEECKRQ